MHVKEFSNPSMCTSVAIHSYIIISCRLTIFHVNIFIAYHSVPFYNLSLRMRSFMALLRNKDMEGV